MMRAQMHRRQRGVALITAVLIVALGTMLAATVFFRGYLDQRRSATLFALDQAYEVALGAEAWAADFLRQDKQDSKTDHFGEAWAQAPSAAAARRWRHGRRAPRGYAGPVQPE